MEPKIAYSVWFYEIWYLRKLWVCGSRAVIEIHYRKIHGGARSQIFNLYIAITQQQIVRFH